MNTSSYEGVTMMYTDGSAIEKNSFDADSFALLLKSTVEACTYVTPPQPEIPPFPEP